MQRFLKRPGAERSYPEKLGLLGGTALLCVAAHCELGSSTPTPARSQPPESAQPALEEKSSVGEACATSEPGAERCFRNCQPNEVCLTHVFCGPDLGDSGPGINSCRVENSAPRSADDRCHRGCALDSDCEAGEVCVKRSVGNCMDLGLTVMLCCSAAKGC